MNLSGFTFRGFFPPLKRPPNQKHGNVTTESKPMDQMFVDESSNPCAQEHITHENTVTVFLSLATRFMPQRLLH